MDGYDKPLTLAAALTVGPKGIHIDYAGTSPASSYGINVVLNYALAYTAFGRYAERRRHARRHKPEAQPQ